MTAAPTVPVIIESRIAEIKARINQISSETRRPSATSFEATLSSVLGALDTKATEFDDVAGADGGRITGQSVVDSAKKYLGVPYVYGGNDPAKGLDCSSLVQRAYSDLGIKLPRVAADQARQGTPVASLAQAKPGDLIAFGSPVDHIGIYAGNNKMVVAPRRGEVVKIQEVYTTPTSIRRIINSPDVSSVTPRTSGSSDIKRHLQSTYDQLFISAGTKHGVSADLLAAVAKQESGFNPNARSNAGAQGLMQIMPGTARGLGVNALDPAQAVDGAARMLSGLIKKFGSIELALAAYNAGPGAVSRYGGIPPYKETQNYVKKVTSLMGRGA